MGTKSKKINDNGITIVKKMPDYSKDPTIKKRAEEAIELLKKVGLPESYTKEYGVPDFFKKKG